MKTLFTLLGAVAFLVVFLVVLIPVWGWAIAKLWLWFVVPLGLVPLSWAHAYGLSIIIGLTSHQWHATPEELGERIECVARSVVAPFMAVFVGWIVLHWM